MGETLFRKAFKFGGCRVAEAQGAAAARRSYPLGSALDPRASGSGAAHLRPGGGGKAAGVPAPPPLASCGAALAPPQAPRGKTRARQVPDELTGPVQPPPPPVPPEAETHPLLPSAHSAPRGRDGPGPSTGPSPARRPGSSDPA